MIVQPPIELAELAAMKHRRPKLHFIGGKVYVRTGWKGRAFRQVVNERPWWWRV